VQANDAVRVYPTQVGSHDDTGGGLGINWWHTQADKKPDNIVVKVLGLEAKARLHERKPLFF
jgi:hypothetical protein